VTVSHFRKTLVFEVTNTLKELNNYKIMYLLVGTTLKKVTLG